MKPFHTKLDEIVDIENTFAEVPVTLSEDVQQTIHLDFEDFTSIFTGETRENGDNWNQVEGTDTGNDWSYTESYDNGNFHQPHMYASENNPLRQHNLHVDFGTVLGITVQTNTSGNTVDNDTRTFIMIKNLESNIPSIVALEESKATTTTTELAHDSDTVTLTDASAFANSGFAYMNNEIFEYVKSANDLQIIARSTANTFEPMHAVGSVIVDVTHSFLTSAEVGTTMLNDMSESILTSTDSLAAAELQALGKGITL